MSSNNIASGKNSATELMPDSLKCWLSLAKIFDLCEHISGADGSIFTKKRSAFEEVLFMNSKAVGRVQGEVVIE